MVEYSDFIQEINDIRLDSMLNEVQKQQFIRTTIHSFMIAMTPATLSAIQAAIRMSSEHLVEILTAYGASKNSPAAELSTPQAIPNPIKGI